VEKIKVCLNCGKSFTKPYKTSQKQWGSRKFCSKSCSAKLRIGEKSPGWKGGLVTKICPICNKSFAVNPSRKNISKTCSRECMGKQNKTMWGKNKILHPHWLGGKTISDQGYVYLYVSNHPRQHNNYRREHHIVMEKHLGRYLTPEEVVHHKNGVRDDNRIENLILFPSQAEHCVHHKFGEN